VIRAIRGTSPQERARQVDTLPVLLGRDGVWKAVDFRPHVVIELPRPIGHPLRRPVAQQDSKLATHLGERLPQGAAVREGPEIPGMIILPEAHEAKPGQFLPGVHPHEKEALVIREVGVVARLPLLDELALEQDRLGFGFHDYCVEVGNHLHQGPDLRVERESPRRLEIRGNPFLKRLCLTHVDDPPYPVPHQVNTGFVRQPPHLFLERGGDAAI